MPKTKTPAKKKRPPVAHKKRSLKKPAPVPVASVSPSPMPLPAIAPSPAYKELPQRHNRVQLWLAVLASTIIIGVFWLYFAQRNFMQLPNVVSESIENAQVDTLVNDLQQNYSELQANMGTLSNIANQTDDQNAQVNNTAPTNSNDELNNLFSDLQ